MFVPFENLPEDSKIWIYPSNRKFSDDEMNEIENDLKAPSTFALSKPLFLVIQSMAAASLVGSNDFSLLMASNKAVCNLSYSFKSSIA